MVIEVHLGLLRQGRDGLTVGRDRVGRSAAEARLICVITIFEVSSAELWQLAIRVLRNRHGVQMAG